MVPVSECKRSIRVVAIEESVDEKKEAKGGHAKEAKNVKIRSIVSSRKRYRDAKSVTFDPQFIWMLMSFCAVLREAVKGRNILGKLREMKGILQRCVAFNRRPFVILYTVQNIIVSISGSNLVRSL